MIMYLCGVRPFLCSAPWFRDSPARFWYFVADHIDEFVVRPAQRAAVRKNVDFFLRRLQPPRLSVPLFLLPGETKLLRKKSWVLSAVKTARHLKVSFGKRGVWADVVNAKRICRDAVVPFEQKTRMLGSDAPGPRGLCRLPGAWRLPKWPVVNELSRKLCRVWDRWSKCLCVADRVRLKGRLRLSVECPAIACGTGQT